MLLSCLRLQDLALLRIVYLPETAWQKKKTRSAAQVIRGEPANSYL